MGAAIIVLSLIPQPPQPVSFNGIDKLEHGLAYALLSFLSCLGFRRREAKAFRYVLLPAVLFLLGTAIEIIQPSVGRNFDWFDMITNALGVLSGWLAAEFVYSVKRAREDR